MDTTELGRIALRRRLMEIGVSQAYASELSNGKRAPKLELAGRICDQIGIPVDAWVHGNPAASMWEVLITEAIAKRDNHGKEDGARGAA